MDALSNIGTEYWVYLAIFFIAIIAGLVDAIAGGGGLITIPSLLLVGVPPMIALGTNKLQAVIGELTTSIIFIKNKQVSIKGLFLGLSCTAIGAVLGAISVSLFDKSSLEIILPIMMVIITIYSVTSNKLKATSKSKPKITTTQFMVLCGLLIGFYNGFFGPGTGSIWMLAFVILLGHTIKQATMATKPLNLIGNISSLVFFIMIGHVDYKIGLVMGAGQIIGAFMGSKFVLKYGSNLVRPVFISVTMLMTGKLIYESLPI